MPIKNSILFIFGPHMSLKSLIIHFKTTKVARIDSIIHFWPTSVARMARESFIFGPQVSLKIFFGPQVSLELIGKN